MTRNDTIFSLRYAVRVLERTTRFWARIDTLIKGLSLLSGSAAIFALGNESKTMTLALGLFFALTQAVEFSLRPSDRSAQALGERTAYARLLARQASFADDALDAAYQQIASDDNLIAMEGLRRIAYNDVVEERGNDSSNAYVLSFWQRMMEFLA